MQQIFYVIYITDPELRAYINAIRLICNPTEKSSAHITVRGPYKRQLKKKFVEKCNAKIHNSIITVSGVSNFFNSNQNTVFFSCDSPALSGVWKKRDYGYNPHITLYDGNSRQFAKQLFELMNMYKFNFSFHAHEMRPLFTIRGQAKFPVLYDFDDEFIFPVVGQHLDMTMIRSMSDWDKLRLVDKVCKYLAKYNSIKHKAGLPKTSDESPSHSRLPLLATS